jgi:hypothetical protein
VILDHDLFPLMLERSNQSLKILALFLCQLLLHVLFQVLLDTLD